EIQSTPANQRALLRPILALISQLLSALDVVQRHHLKPSPAGDPIRRREAAPRCDRLTHLASAPVRLSEEGALSGKSLSGWRGKCWWCRTCGWSSQTTFIGKYRHENRMPRCVPANT